MSLKKTAEFAQKGQKASIARKTAVKRKKASIAAGIGSIFTPKQAGQMAFDASLGRKAKAAKPAKPARTAKPAKATTTAKATLPGRRPKARTAAGVSGPRGGTFGKLSKKAAAKPATTTAKAKAKVKARRGFGKR